MRNLKTEAVSEGRETCDYPTQCRVMASPGRDGDMRRHRGASTLARVQSRERERVRAARGTRGSATCASLEPGLRKLRSELQTGVLVAEFPFQTSEEKKNTHSRPPAPALPAGSEKQVVSSPARAHRQVPRRRGKPPLQGGGCSPRAAPGRSSERPRPPHAPCAAPPGCSCLSTFPAGLGRLAPRSRLLRAPSMPASQRLLELSKSPLFKSVSLLKTFLDEAFHYSWCC